MTQNFFCKPSELDATDHFFDTFQTCEREVVARWIVLTCRAAGDAWGEFTWEMYLGAGGKPIHRSTLEWFIPRYLSKTEGGWQVLPSFVERLKEYVDTPERRERIASRDREAKEATEDEKRRLNGLVAEVTNVANFEELVALGAKFGFRVEKLLDHGRQWQLWISADKWGEQLARNVDFDKAFAAAKAQVVERFGEPKTPPIPVRFFYHGSGFIA